MADYRYNSSVPSIHILPIRGTAVGTANSLESIGGKYIWIC